MTEDKRLAGKSEEYKRGFKFVRAKFLDNDIKYDSKDQLNKVSSTQDNTGLCNALFKSGSKKNLDCIVGGLDATKDLKGLSPKWRAVIKKK